MDESMFSEKLPRLQIAWDSTSFKLFQECPRKYQYTILDQWVAVRAKAQLDFGIAVHKAIEKYHRLRAKGVDYDDAMLQTVRFCLNTKGQWATGDTLYNHFNLARGVIWYLDLFRNDPAETLILSNGEPAVELSFRFALPLESPDGTPYFWCGHIDRVVKFQGDIIISDIKSTKSGLDQNFTKRFSPNNQLNGYILGSSTILPGGGTRTAMIDGIELKVNFNRFVRLFITRTPNQLHEWMDNTGEWLKMAEQYAEKGFWPMNLESCDKWGGCTFRDICSKDPSTRDQWLTGSPQDFTKREWNPLISREA